MLMIRSNFERLRRKKSFEENRNLPVRTIADEVGLSIGTIQRIKSEPLDRIDCRVIEKLCDYFSCDLCDLLERVPDAPNG